MFRSVAVRAGRNAEKKNNSEQGLEKIKSNKKKF